MKLCICAHDQSVHAHPGALGTPCTQCSCKNFSVRTLKAMVHPTKTMCSADIGKMVVSTEEIKPANMDEALRERARAFYYIWLDNHKCNSMTAKPSECYSEYAAAFASSIQAEARQEIDRLKRELALYKPKIQSAIGGTV